MSDIRLEVTQWINAETKDRAVLRQYTGRASCGGCVIAIQDGQAAGQPTLLDEILDNPVRTEKEQYTAGYQAGWREQELAVERPEVFMSGYMVGRADKFRHRRDSGDGSNRTSSEEVPGAFS